MHNPESLDLFYQISTIPKEQTYKPRLKLYDDTAKAFNSLHASIRGNDSCECGPFNAERIHHVSHIYRDLLSRYFHTLIESKEDARVYIERKRIQHIIAVWELADIMFFSTDSQETTSLKLLKWLNKVDKSFMKYDTQGIFYSASPINHDEFWPMIHKFVLRRQIREVQRVVDTVNSRDSEANVILSYLAEAIRSVPSIPSRLDSTEAAEFKAAERSWCEQMKHVIAVLDDNTSPQSLSWERHRNPIMDTIKILQGDGATIVKHAETPIEAMVALAVYSDPLATTKAIRKLVGSVILAPEAVKNAEEKRTMAYAHIIQGQVCAGFEVSPYTDWWHFSHLVDLLSMTSMHMVADTVCLPFASQDRRGRSIKFRDLAILMHSRNMIEVEELWEVARDYLDTCSDAVRQAGLFECTQCIPKDNPGAITRLIDYSIKHDYKHVVSELFKNLNDHKIDLECFSKGMEYIQINGNAEYLEAICDSAIKHHCQTGQLPIFDGLRLEELNCDLRLPRAKFYIQRIRLQRFVDKCAWAEAADLLYDILTCADTPVDYLPLLLIEGTAIFEEGGSAFSNYQLDMLRSLGERLKTNSNAERGYFLLGIYIARVERISVPDRGVELEIFKRTFSEFVELLLSRHE